MNGSCFGAGSGTGGSGQGGASSGTGAGTGGAGGAVDNGIWGLPTGGGGCSCEVGAGAPARGWAGGALSALALAMLLRRQRKPRRNAGDGARGAEEVER
jgi:MYXO-CTERM domain-containing protein